MLTAEFQEFFLVAVYVPCASRKKKLDYRITWDIDFTKYVDQLQKIKPVIIAGDLNVVKDKIDFFYPKDGMISLRG